MQYLLPELVHLALFNSERCVELIQEPGVLEHQLHRLRFVELNSPDAHLLETFGQLTNRVLDAIYFALNLIEFLNQLPLVVP